MFFRNTKFPRANNFDFLRFLFALIVVCAHTIRLSNNPQLEKINWLFDPYMAVCGFFVISGFLVTKSCLSSSGIQVYFKKRARRVLPAYLLVILLCVLLLPLLGNLPYRQTITHPQTLKYLLANSLFLNFLQPNLPGVFNGNPMNAVDGALWTIKVEVTFYFILPLLIWLTNRWKRFNSGLIVIGILYLLSISFRLFFLYLAKKTGSHLLDQVSHQFPAFLCYFLSGAALLILYEQFKKHQNFLFISAILVYITEYITDVEFLSPLALAIIVLYIAFNFSRLNNFGRYGDISYGIYIFHFPIVQTLLSTFIFMTSFRS